MPRKRVDRMLNALMSWKAIIVAIILIAVLGVVSGCSSTYVSTKVGETEYVWQMSLEKTEVEDE
jgi:hypothetical protein